jgi:hypothetical protein
MLIWASALNPYPKRSRRKRQVKYWPINLGSSFIGEYNANVTEVLPRRSLPDVDRLSVLAATLLLAYSLTHFVDLPVRDIELDVFGIVLTFQINIRTAVAFVSAGLTASGADWLLRDHPAVKGKSTFQHWILPALTAWVIGIPLYQLEFGYLWWSIFIAGGAILMLVLVAEYIVVDNQDLRYPLAAAGLTAVSFMLYLAMAIMLRSIGVRLFLLLPGLGLASSLVVVRTLHLRLQGKWKIVESVVIAFVVVQIAAALHYWPLSPIAFGLGVLGPAYALTSLITGVDEGITFPRVIVEPALVLLVVWSAFLWMR